MESIREEEKAAAAEVERVEKMTVHERRRHELALKRQARRDEDLEPEKQMKDGMDEQKKLLATAQPPTDESKTAVMFERLRGIVLNEEDDT